MMNFSNVLKSPFLEVLIPPFALFALLEVHLASLNELKDLTCGMPQASGSSTTFCPGAP